MKTILTASALRRELSFRSRRHAASRPHELTFGSVPSVVFQDDHGEHGNFHPDSYREIQGSTEWLRRMSKSYTAGRWIPRRWDRSRAELDCANSSDALLMNIFCYPDVTAIPSLCCLLGIANGVRPVFGFKPRIPLLNGYTDQTEIDLKLGSLLLEAKLTESGFQTAQLARILRYAAVEQVFDLDELPRTNDRLQSYQLIRGALAAWHLDQSFAVLCDARRVDLIERWFLIMRAVRTSTLRSRLALVTWQELAATLPQNLQRFLEEKYGIISAG